MSTRWRTVRDSTMPVLLGTLIVAMFYTTTSIHSRMADMENRLGDRITQAETKLSDRITQVETKLSDRITQVETKLSDRITRLETTLSDRITRLETLMEVHLEAHSGPAGAREGR